MPERMPDMDAYENARNKGVCGDFAPYESGLAMMERIEVEGDGDLERGWGLRSMRGVRSVAEAGSTADVAVVAVVRREGAVFGARRGDSGGLTSASL